MWMLAVMYVLLIPGVAVYLHSKHKYGSDIPGTVSLKAACTMIVVLAGIAGAVALGQFPLYSVLVAFGLVFGLVGDIMICQNFLLGMVFFALGHLCYIGGFLLLSEHVFWAVPVFLAVYAAFFLVLYRFRDRMGSLLIPAAVYGAVIVAMLSLSVTMPFSVKNGLVPLAGAVLFTVSDAILAYKSNLGAQDLRFSLSGLFRVPLKNVFDLSHSLLLDSFDLYCYFIGQSLFAASIFFLH